MEAKGRLTEYWTQHPLEGMQLGGGFCPYLFPAAEPISRRQHESGLDPSGNGVTHCGSDSESSVGS